MTDFRKIIIIGVAPGELAGDISKMYEANLTRPKFVRDDATGVLIRDPRGGIEDVLDEQGKPVKHRRCGARPPGEYGPDDPGDPGIPTLRFRVVFWLRAAPGQFKPIERFDRAGNERAAWLVPSQVPTDGAQGLQKQEADALRAGELIERVIDEAGGQIEESMPREEYDAILLRMWDEMQAELVTPAIVGVKQLPPEVAALHLRSLGGKK